MANPILAVVTVSSRVEADKIVNSLLEKRLIACANVFGPVASSFWWRGGIDRAEEYIIFMKTEARLFDKLTEQVKNLHSYEVPEIIALPIIEGFKPYLEWLNTSVTVE